MAGGKLMKRFAIYGLVAIGLLFVTVLAGAFSGARAVAQTVIKAVLMRNVDEPGRVPFQETRSVPTSCPFGACSAGFSPVPPGKRLVIRKVSGILSLSPSASLVVVQLLSESGGQSKGVPNVFVPAHLQATTTSTSYYVFNSDVLAYVDAGASPFVLAGVYFGGIGSFSGFTLTGYYIDVP
jgi:hypothetical protein